MSENRLRALCLSLLCVPVVWGQGYDHLIPNHTTIFDATAAGVAPGETVGIEAGERSYLKIINAAGTESAPIVFVNVGGKVRIGNSDRGEAIFVGNSSHFELRGDGDPNFKYGIEIWDSGDHGIEIADQSTNYEICFTEVMNVNFAGIMSKTDPQCNGTGQRANFTQYDISIHDNYIHDVGGEALYIGNSFYSGYNPSDCGTLYPHDIIGLRVFNNRVERTGWDGIQVGCASSDAQIYNNSINTTGLANAQYQKNGLQIGEGTTGKCYGNTIINAGSMGIVMLGIGNNDVFNNLIVNAAESGVFCVDRPDTLNPSYIRIYNNTIVNPGDAGFVCDNEISTVEFKNNLVVLPNTTRGMVETNGETTKVETAGNVFARDTTSFDFVNESGGDYRIGPSSAALDCGVNLLSVGIMMDKEGNNRPLGSTFDAGAYEFSERSFTADPPSLPK